MSEHTHDENCSCGCHDHNHTHEHPHTHDENCSCGCQHHHSSGEEIVDNALIISKKGSVSFDEQPADEALSTIAGKIIAIAKELAVGDAVLGHVKTLFASDAGKATISITNIPSPTITKHEGWDGSKFISSGTVSANILSLANTDIPAENMLDELLDA